MVTPELLYIFRIPIDNSTSGDVSIGFSECLPHTSINQLLQVGDIIEADQIHWPALGVTIKTNRADGMLLESTTDFWC